MKSRPGTYYVTVLEDVKTGRIVGAATLVLELKFIHRCNQVHAPLKKMEEGWENPPRNPSSWFFKLAICLIFGSEIEFGSSHLSEIWQP